MLAANLSFKKKSSIFRHVASVKHKKGLSDFAKSKSESQPIMECLQRRDKTENAAGSCLPTELQLFHFEVAESFLDAGIPLEKHGERRTSSTRKRKKQTPGRTKDVKQASIIFHGTASWVKLLLS